MELRTATLLAPTLLAIHICTVAGTETGVAASTTTQLDRAVASASAGQTLVVQDGTYRDWRIRFHAAGTRAAPVTLQAQTPGGVIFTGESRIEISGTDLVVSGFLFDEAHTVKHSAVVEFKNARRCRLTQCAFIRCGDPHSTFTRTINVAYGSRNNLLYQTDNGIRLDAGQYREHEFIDRESSGSYEAASGVLIENNVILHSRDAGIRLGQNRGRSHQGVLRNALPHHIEFRGNRITSDRGVLVEDLGSHHITWKMNWIWLRGEAQAGLATEGIVSRESANWNLPADSPVLRCPEAMSLLGNSGTHELSGASSPGTDKEQAGSGLSPRPLTPGDVGPSWMTGSIEIVH